MKVSHWRTLCCWFCTCALFVNFSASLFAASHEVIVDNPKVRVVRVVIEPGETTEIDNPDLDRVVVWLQNGSAKTILRSGNSVNDAWNKNEVKWERAGSSRSIRLNGSSSVTAIVVELKGKGDVRRAPTSPQNPWIVDPKHYKIEFENNEVRVTRVTIGPKEGTPLHEHSLDRIVVYLTQMDFRVVPEGMTPEHAVQNADAVAWGTPVRHTEYNLSDKGFEAVVVEPKY